MPWVIMLLAPGLRDDAPSFAMTVELSRIGFPYLPFISLASLHGGALNSIDPLLPCRGHADPAQPGADRHGAGPLAAVAQQRLCRLDRRGDRGSAAMAVTADRLRRPRRQHDVGVAALGAIDQREDITRIISDPEAFLNERSARTISS